MTLTKINQLSTPAQATRWQSRMDIVGLCICRGDMPQPPWIPLAAAKTLRDLLCGVIQRDDCGFLDEREPYREMMRAGVELFQFEVDSPDNFELSRSDLLRANAFFEEVPALICDSAPLLRDCPIVSARGFFFNIAALPSNANHDCSSLRRTEGDIARALRTITPGANAQ